ncbi:FecR domain-containing protein [Verrucomicrobiaceae bacterium N1E253]|uniref:FecR domain-containing protein n=1 Tax=Oceaniferula marina TaxID=2748318 RepID=A0A851GCZ2_9BACT|nr:LamG-like jellyroll fold domain-containing protein [Oceaniferula marina]NWK55049.1 FecR domain-containing protein [Oceaniferula marina]
MHRNQLEESINDLLEGVISEQDFAKLQQELKDNAEARNTYKQYIQVQNTLEQHAAGTNTLTSSNVIPINQILKKQQRRQIKIALISAAAILVLSAVLLRLFFVDSETPPSLAFQTSPGTLFTITHDGAEDQPNGQTMHPGSRLQLSQGAIELSFASGVKSIITAPADLTLHAEDQLYLGEGTAWFHVPKGAEGFQVKTRDLNIVDLGTEFGVLAKTNDHDEVHVLKGKVEVSALRVRKETLTLDAGQARRIDPVGRLTLIESKPSAFLTSLPQSLLFLHWSFDQKQGIEVDGPQVDGNHPLASEVISKYHGAVQSCKGRRGEALRLNSNGQHVTTNWPGFSGVKPRSVAFWIKLPKGGQPQEFAAIIGWGDNSRENYKWEVVVRQNSSDQKGRVSISWGTTIINTFPVLTPERWHHVILNDYGRTDAQGDPVISIFVDGQQVESRFWARTGDPINTTTYTADALPLSMGVTIRHSSIADRRRYLKADLDELYVFDGALTAEQARQFYTKQLSYVKKTTGSTPIKSKRKTTN